MNNKIMQVLRAIRSPEQAKQMAMQGLQQSNPQIAKVLQDCMNSGMQPAQILSQAIEAGQINYNQFCQFKNVVNQYSRFLPFKIDQSELNNLESCFKNKTSSGPYNFRF